MWSGRQSCVLVVATVLAVACLGCGNEGPPNDPGQANGQSGNNGTGKVTPTNGPPSGNNVSTKDPPRPAEMPKVFLTEEQRRSCVKGVGEMMPDAELPDLGDKPQPVSGLRGEKLTVVCLWKSGETDEGRLRALEILGDLQDLSDVNLEKGVRVVGINEGDPPEVVRLCINGAEAAFPVLLDPDGAFFEKVATETLPRIYLLDPKGEILWFDLEYSLTTRRNLKKGIQVALGEI